MNKVLLHDHNMGGDAIVMERANGGMRNKGGGMKIGASPFIPPPSTLKIDTLVNMRVSARGKKRYNL